MAIIYKHGKQKSFTTICPECGCVFEYTVNEINPDNYIKCPDCDNYVKHTTFYTTHPTYKRNKELENEAIEASLSYIDFDSLASALKVISREVSEYDFCGNRSAEELKKIAREQLESCFEQMETYGYVTSYKNGDMTIGYCIEGVFNVETYYDLSDNSCYCICLYTIAEGRL